jgi:membrane protein required for colicin V production
MTWFDFAMLAVLALSALLAFFRGFVREVLGVGAWVGAIIISIWFFPFVSPRFEQWIHAKEFADPAAYGAVFLVALIVLSVVSSWVGALVRGSALGGVDRTLGIVFGLVRGAVLLVFCYFAAGLFTTPQEWPVPVRDARFLPYVYEGARDLVTYLPAGYQPHVPEPPVTAPPSLGDLLQPTPQGTALTPTQKQ